MEPTAHNLFSDIDGVMACVCPDFVDYVGNNSETSDMHCFGSVWR